MSNVPYESLEETIAAQALALPPGSPFVLLPSLRARDFVEVVRGAVLPFGLVSSQLGVSWLGEHTHDELPRVAVFRGVLSAAHQRAVLALLDEGAKANVPTILVADDLDPQIFSLVLVNHLKGTVRVSALTPRAADSSPQLEAFARLTGASVGSAANQLVFGTLGTAERVIAGLDTSVIVSLHATHSVAVVYVGGRDLAHARDRARAARSFVPTAF